MNRHTRGLAARSLLCALVLVSSAARAEDAPAKRPPPTAEQKAKYKAAMKRGKARGAAGDLDGAIAAFKEAAAALDGDGRALSELGLAALRKKDLKLAEDATRRSIAASAEPSVKGASLYNLGRIFEEQGNKPAAVDAYRKSLDARPNAVVRERLLGLDPAAAAAADPASPHPMLGPFPSLKEFCASWQKTECTEEHEHEEGEPDPYVCAAHAVKLARAKAPYLGAELWVTGCDGEFDDHLPKQDGNYHLAVRLAAGWFVAQSSGETFNMGRTDEKLSDVTLAVEDLLAGGAPEIALRYTNDGAHEGGCQFDTWKMRYLVVAGVGPSGKPSATGRLLLDRDESSVDNGGSCEDVKESSNKEKLAVKFSEGQIEITTSDGKPLKGDARAKYSGKHAFVFP